MKVCVIGGGGREHTLAWKLAQSDSVEKYMPFRAVKPWKMWQSA